MTTSSDPRRETSTAASRPTASVVITPIRAKYRAMCSLKRQWRATQSARRGATSSSGPAFTDSADMGVDRKPLRHGTQAEPQRKMWKLQQEKSPPHYAWCGGLPRSSSGQLLLLRLVHVVADDAAKDRSGSATNDRALHLVPTGDRANHSTSAGANRGVTFGVLDNNRCRSRSAVDRSRRIRPARRAPTSGRTTDWRPVNGARRRCVAPQRRGGRGRPRTLSRGDA